MTFDFVNIILRLARIIPYICFLIFFGKSFFTVNYAHKKFVKCAISLSSEITFSISEEISGSLKAFSFSTNEICVRKFTSSEKKRFYFSPKGFIVCYVTYFKITVIGFFFFLYPTNTVVVTLFVIGYSVSIGFGVYKFIL